MSASLGVRGSNSGVGAFSGDYRSGLGNKAYQIMIYKKKKINKKKPFVLIIFI